MKYSTIYHISSKKLRVNCLRDGFIMYKDEVLICIREVIPHIPDSMMPLNFCKNTKLIVNFKTDDTTPRFDFFSQKKMYALYLTEIMRTDWLHILDEYCDGNIYTLIIYF